MLYKAKMNFQADELNLFITRGDVFSDEKKVIKDFITKYPAIFEKIERYERAETGEVIIPIEDKNPEGIKPETVITKKKDKKPTKKGETLFDKDFDAQAEPGVIPVFIPQDGEPVKIHARDLPDALPKGDDIY